MTSKRYLWFLMITNLIWWTAISGLIFIKTNLDSSNGSYQPLIVSLALVVIITVIVEIGLPLKWGYNPYKRVNGDPMKQNILFWTKDEREVQGALKVYASGFVASVTFLMLLLFGLLLVVDMNHVSKWDLINGANGCLLVYFWYSNIKMVIDWRKYLG